MIVIDAGNTNIVFGFYSKNKLTKVIRIKTEKKINKKNKVIKNFFKFNEKLLSNFENKVCILSSVVPSINMILKKYFKKNNFQFYIINSKKIPFNGKINYNKKQIGSDRIANYAFAYKKKIKNCIVIDFGTATTLDVLNKDGIYNGGVITPGIELSLGSLKKMTAKLPLVKFKKTKKIMGTSTINAIQSGFFWGYVSMIEGLIKKINLENEDNHKIVLTGGNANFFKNMFENVFVIDDLFTSRGLHYLINEFDK